MKQDNGVELKYGYDSPKVLKKSLHVYILLIDRVIITINKYRSGVTQ